MKKITTLLVLFLMTLGMYAQEFEKIYFSTTPYEMGEDPTKHDNKTAFTTSENIYGYAILGKNTEDPRNFGLNSIKYSTPQGVEYTEFKGESLYTDATKTMRFTASIIETKEYYYMFMYVNPKPENALYMIYDDGIADLLNYKKGKKLKIQFTLKGRSRYSGAQSDKIIITTAGNQDESATKELIAKAKEAHEKYQKQGEALYKEGILGNQTLPKKFDAKRPLKDKNLTAENLTNLFLKAYEGDKDVPQIVKITNVYKRDEGDREWFSTFHNKFDGRSEKEKRDDAGTKKEEEYKKQNAGNQKSCSILFTAVDKDGKCWQGECSVGISGNGGIEDTSGWYINGGNAITRYKCSE